MFIDVPILQCFNVLSYKYPLEREPHTSLLVEMGFSPLEIANRLGHESVKTTMDTYSHLYPDKDRQPADSLDKLRQTPQPKENT